MIHFVVALACEARPLIRRYGLKAGSPTSAFRVYRSPQHDLVVCGVGKIAAAAATAYLGAGANAEDEVWINVGVAGHRSLNVGSGLVADRILDRASGQAWYPPQLFAGEYHSSLVISVDQVEKEYAEEAAYDMEAAGFWPTATRFSTAELVQCYKVVSDTRQSAARGLTADAIEVLIESRLPEIDCLTLELEGLRAQMPAAPSFDIGPFLERWRLTVSQQRRLRHLLRRWCVLTGASAPACGLEAVLMKLGSAGEIPTGKEALTSLQRLIDDLPVDLVARQHCCRRE